jgi:hypothetical protein
MAAELKRKDDDTIILAMHPGEVATFVALLALFSNTSDYL